MGSWVSAIELGRLLGVGRLGVVLLACLALAGCAGSGGGAASGERGADLDPETLALALAKYPHRVVSNDEQYSVAFRIEPRELPLNESFAIEAWVFEGDRWEKPATDVELVADAAMPQHRHGMLVRPTVVAGGAGRFRVEGMLFHMPGAWQLYFDITRGASTERAQCAIELE